MYTIRNSDDPKMAAVMDAVSVLKSMGFKTIELGWFILSGRLIINIDASNNDYEIGSVQFDGIELAGYQIKS